MSIPLPYFFSALITPTIHALSNIGDNFLGEHFKDHLPKLIAFSKIFNLIITAPFIIYFAHMLTIPLPMLGLIALSATINVAYFFPYFMALRHTDTSIVASLFSLGKIFIPVMAAYFLNERLSILQYTGFFTIIGATVLLTFNPKKLHINASLLYMLPVSLLIGIHAILNKYVLMHGVNWQASASWHFIFEAAIGMIFVLSTPKTCLSFYKNTSSKIKIIFCISSTMSPIGNIGFVFAMSLLPASIVKSIEGTQPLFVSLYAKLFGKKLPEFFKEDSTGIHPLAKYMGLIMVFTGTVMTVI